MSALLVTGAVSAQQPGFYRTSCPISMDSLAKIKRTIRAIPASLFQAGSFTGTEGISIPYRLLSPEKMDNGLLVPEKEGKRHRYPLVLVLHASGVSGTDNISQLAVTAKFWAQPAIRSGYPAFVLAPQFPDRSSNYSLDPGRGVLVSIPAPGLGVVLQLVDSLKRVLPIDSTRIYVMGFSMGASATINSIGLRPGLFAAAVAISGIPDFAHLPTLIKTPLWIIHGNADPENPIATDSLLFATIRSRHGSCISYWEIDGLQHDIYPPLLTGDAIPAWLFRHHSGLLSGH